MSRAHPPISRLEHSDELVHPGRKLTEQQFIDWVGDGWAEWVNGEVIVMSPVNFEHADLHSFLVALVRGWIDENDLGKVLTEPFQIRFDFVTSRRSPDILFVSNRRMSQMQRAHYEGGPDVIFEIISPDSASRDRREKFLEYQKAGVREYWIVDPLLEQVEAYRLDKSGKFVLMPSRGGKIASKAIRGFHLKPDWLWQKKFPKVSALLKEIGSKRRT